LVIIDRTRFKPSDCYLARQVLQLSLYGLWEILPFGKKPHPTDRSCDLLTFITPKHLSLRKYLINFSRSEKVADWSVG